MSCLKSFTIHSGTSINASNAKIYVQNLNNYWLLESARSSTFTIQGFKNVNIHGIEINGYLQGFQPNATDNCIVMDWNTNVELQGGTIPQISGVITGTNDWLITNSATGARKFTLGKYNQKIMFASPFESVKTIEFQDIKAQGIAAQVLTSVSLEWDFQWIFYYTYEGEDF